MRRQELEATDVWTLYEKGKDHHHTVNLYSKTEQAYNFYEDRQWEGLESGGETLPFYNFIKPTVKYKTSSVAMNTMVITYSPMHSSDPMLTEVCKNLDRYAVIVWEKSRMDSLIWRLIKRANIAGDDYLYMYDGGKKTQLIDNVNIYLGDEQESDIQSQPYILLYERKQVKDVKAIAEANELDSSLVLPDEDDFGKSAEEVKTLDGKCTSILKLWKEEGQIHYAYSTRELIYDEGVIEGLTMYPIVSLVIEPIHNSARGLGEVRPLIPNQIEVNKTLYRRSVAVKNAAFPQLVYDETRIENPESIGKSGVAIATQGSVGNVRDMITFLQPNPISGEAKMLEDELLNTTKNLAGAGDAALGQINPEQASGQAIIAVRDQAAIPLNETINSYKQFMEDYAKVLYAMTVAYNPNGLTVSFKDEQGIEQNVDIKAKTLSELEVDVRIDVSNSNPYSKYAQERSLENLFMNKYISFEEYINALDDSSSVPKNKMIAVIEQRKAQEQVQQPIQQPAQQGQLDPAMMQAMLGGNPNGMQQM